jgi:predicted PurR-regulated permease PerM
MQPDDSTIRNLLTTNFTEAVVRLSLIALLAVLCVRVFAPFADLMLWALILAVALYPLHQRLARWLGGRQRWAATLVVLSGLVLIGVPTGMLGDSFARQMHKTYIAFENNAVNLKSPDAAVADWPLVGKQIYSAWSAAADNLPAFLQKNQEQLKTVAKRALLAAANTAGSLLVFLGSVFIAGIMMAYGESGSLVMQRICTRLAGATKGQRLLTLSTATIRSVASGVIGVAFIQALLLGIGFILAGIPAAGVLAFAVLFLGIVQLPATIISLPVVVYLWWAGDASTASNIFYTIYLMVAGMADNVLKPLLLGRGVEAPMPVILLGALGGMVSGGIIGLFTGAVLLTVGYQIFMAWVDHAEVDTGVETVPTGAVDSTLSVDE